MRVLSSLISNAKKIENNDFNARVNRINWKFLEERVFSVFKKLESDGKDYFGSFGNLWVTSNIGERQHNYEVIPVDRRVNAIHIKVGHRNLGVSHVNEKLKTLKKLTEYNAQLWYSQSPSGDVMVFVAPYVSDVHKMNESEIVIGYFTNPSQISTKLIEGHFSTFFKYCRCTSINSSASYSSYMYRRFLLLKDYRYKSKVRSQLFGFLERCVPLFVGVVGVIATLYAAGKLNL